MSLGQHLLAGTRVCGSVALRLFTCQPSSPWLPTLFYGPLAVAGILWNLMGERPPAWAWVTLPASGLLLWTLLEYVLHSRLFHDAPPRLAWLSLSHGSHHDAPDDPNRIVARLAFSLPVALVLYPVLSLLLWSPPWAALVMVGVVAGYLSYEGIHYSIHRVPTVRRLVRPLASHHLHHHFADPSRCYGVTTPLWDWVFRTGRRHRVPQSQSAESPPILPPQDAVIG
jgi:sterol desaturase/sphingolipid hydroxylase (fatty acid hydroxylase superfamily)